LPQERALANDTLLRLIPRMPLKSLRHLAERVCLMEVPSQMLVRRLINDPRIEVSGPLLENAMTVDDSDLIAVCNSGNPAKLKLMARRRLISPALSKRSFSRMMSRRCSISSAIRGRPSRSSLCGA
jgi:uncharacterized protein (DUF2336 family)